jgi:excisionase family DNA binding protein
MQDIAGPLAELSKHLRRAIDSLERVAHALDHAVVEHAQPAAKSPAQAATRLAYSLEQVQELTGLGRSTLYEAIAANELRAVKRGRRTLILSADLRSWLDHLPQSRGGEGNREES